MQFIRFEQCNFVQVSRKNTCSFEYFTANLSHWDDLLYPTKLVIYCYSFWQDWYWKLGLCLFSQHQTCLTRFQALNKYTVCFLHALICPFVHSQHLTWKCVCPLKKNETMKLLALPLLLLPFPQIREATTFSIQAILISKKHLLLFYPTLNYNVEIEISSEPNGFSGNVWKWSAPKEVNIDFLGILETIYFVCISRLVFSDTICERLMSTLYW